MNLNMIPTSQSAVFPIPVDILQNKSFQNERVTVANVQVLGRIMILANSGGMPRGDTMTRKELDLAVPLRGIWQESRLRKHVKSFLEKRKTIVSLVKVQRHHSENDIKHAPQAHKPTFMLLSLGLNISNTLLVYQ